MIHCMKIIFLYLNIVFVLANKVDPDEMRQYGAFHQGSMFVKACKLYIFSKYRRRRMTLLQKKKTIADTIEKPVDSG